MTSLLAVALSCVDYGCEHGETLGADVVTSLGKGRIAMWERAGITHLAPNVTESNWVVLLACVLIAGAHEDAFGCECAQHAPPAEFTKAPA